MLITLVRHGESVSNAAGIWQGQSNSPLSPLGRRQARLLAQRVAAPCVDQAIDRVISSDLTRAHATALAAAVALSLPVETSPVWREVDLGRWEGLTREEVARRYPDEIAALARGEDVPVGGAERWSDLGRRVGLAFEELSAVRSEHVLVVAHGGVIVTLLSMLLGVVELRPRLIGRLSNTSMTTVQRDSDGCRVVAYNDGLHVDSSASWARERDERRRAVVALRARAHGGALDGLPAALQGAAAPSGVLPELEASPEALVGWATGLLGRPTGTGTGTATGMATPAPGARCLTTSHRPGGTLWTWNEGGVFAAPGSTG